MHSGVRQRAVGGSARHRAVAAFVFLLHGTDSGPDRLRAGDREGWQDTDVADQRLHHGGARLRLCPMAATEKAGGLACDLTQGPMAKQVPRVIRLRPVTRLLAASLPSAHAE